MNARKYPRTMEEAFGPGHRGAIYEKYEPFHMHDKIVMAGSVIVALFVAAVLVFT